VTSENICYLFEGKMQFASDGGITTDNPKEKEFVVYQAIQNAMENGALLDNFSFPEVLNVSYVNDSSDYQDKNSSTTFVAPSSATKSMNPTEERSMNMGVLSASMCGTVLLALVALKIRRSRRSDSKDNNNVDDVEEALSSVDDRFIDTDSRMLYSRSYDDTATFDGVQSINTVSDIPPSLTNVEDSILSFAHTLTCGFQNAFK
jgi:hypothetical protein